MTEGIVSRVTLAPATLPFDEIIARVQAAQPLVLVGYPSLITKLADAQRAGRLAITPISVTCTSEPLSRDQSDRIAAAFGVAPSNCFGSTEGVCGSAAPGDDVIELSSDTAIVELVDEDDQPVPPGVEADHVLVTNLLSRAQPLIRYRLDDRMIQAEPSPDHGHLRVRVSGRHDPVLQVGGVEVHPLTVRSALLRHAAVGEYQVVARPGRLHVDAVAVGELDTADVAAHLEKALADAGAKVPVTVDVVEGLPRDPVTGKVRRFVTA
jgi:phenylacetate-coenzyme A ligase PaaK-like adenylate-forming protein